MLKLKLAIAALTGLSTFSAVAAIDTRFSKNPTFISASNMLRQEFMSQYGAACGSEDPGKLNSRVPFYVYAPATSTTAITPGKYSAVVFLHGLSEQGASVPNTCWNHGATTYSNISTGLIKVETQAGGPGAAIVNAKFNPSQKMLVIIPQSMNQGGFTADIIRRVVEDASNQLALQGVQLDADKVYLTGLSMGGGSLLTYVAANPNHFAAIVPIEASGGIDPCFVDANQIAVWGFAGGASGNMFSASLKTLINGSASCPKTPVQYVNAAYTCQYENKSCTLLSPTTPNTLRATFMPANAHSGWTEVYNGTHSALPTTEKNIYNWMLAQSNSARGKPLFPVQYVNSPVNPPNSAPTFSPAADISVNAGSTAETFVNATDVDAGDVISLNVKGVKPAFVTFTDQGNGQGKIVASPSAAQVGTTSVEIEASDIAGAKSSVIVDIEVTNPTTTPHSINLSTATILPGAQGNPAALIDEQTAPAPTTSWFPGWQAVYPVEAVIDLGRVYTITEISLYDANSMGKLEVYDGDASHSQSVVVTDNLVNYNIWNKYPVNITTRYLKLKKYNGANMSEILIKGF
ncbi:MAG TPA: hypothetical protein VIZ65_07840 [Cellvibrionaceae bacterium]